MGIRVNLRHKIVIDPLLLTGICNNLLETQRLCQPQTHIALCEMQMVITAAGQRSAFCCLGHAAFMYIALGVQVSCSGPTSHADSWSPLRDGTAPSQECTSQHLPHVIMAQGKRQYHCGVIVHLLWYYVLGRRERAAT